MSRYDKFHSYLCELDENYSRLALLLHDKLKAVGEGDTETLDRIIKDEQVYVLLSRGFDANIARHRADLSLNGEKLSDIIPELPAEEQQRFTDVFRRLSTGLNECRSLNETCQEQIEKNLHIIGRNIRELKQQGAAVPYEKGGTAAGGLDGSAHLFSKSV